MSTSADLRTQLQSLLQSEADRGKLLRELSNLAQNGDLLAHADLWAPALYERDAAFFESFLVRHLQANTTHQRDSIRSLLARAEADGHDSLFQGLYRKIAREEEWNNELLALAHSSASDAEVQQAVLRRDLSSLWFALTPETAFDLYKRSPALFGGFIRQHIQRRWWRGQHSEERRYVPLREEAQRNGDEELAWLLFRKFSSEQDWRGELQRLLKQQIPASQIVPELEKRHPEYIWQTNATILIDFIERYGMAVLPYIDRNIHWLRQHTSDRLLAAIKQMGDETLYWRLFFKVGTIQQWNAELRRLLAQPWNDQQLYIELQRRMPPAQRWSHWQLQGDVAAAFYRRNPALFRPLLEQLIQPWAAYGQPQMHLLELFQEAEQQGDEAFLNFLSYRILQKLQSLGWRAFPHQQYAHHNPKEVAAARQEYDTMAGLLVARFERLCAQSPEIYVRHAANILSRFEPYGFWNFKKEAARNPALSYLLDQQREIWRRSPDAMRELLESPNIFVQILGLDMLSEGGEDAAQRVVENLPALRALLLSRAKINTKKRALQGLEQAARQGPRFAAQVLPVLEETMDFRGKRAIDQRIMVSFVRLRRQLAAGTQP